MRCVGGIGVDVGENRLFAKGMKNNEKGGGGVLCGVKMLGKIIKQIK